MTAVNLPYNQAIDIMLHPVSGTTPITLTDIEWASNHSAVFVAPSPDGLRGRVSCDPASPESALVGQQVDIGILGGGLIEHVQLTITASSSAPVRATSLGVTVSAPFPR